MFALPLFNLCFIRQPQFFGHPAHHSRHAYLQPCLHIIAFYYSLAYYCHSVALLCFALLRFVQFCGYHLKSLQNSWINVWKFNIWVSALRHAPTPAHVRQQMDMWESDPKTIKRQTSKQIEMQWLNANASNDWIWHQRARRKLEFCFFFFLCWQWYLCAHLIMRSFDSFSISIYILIFFKSFLTD